MKTMKKNEWQSFINNIIEDESRKVLGVKAKREKFVFGPLNSADELRLDYDVTILPPKKYFLPTHEDLMRYDISRPFDVEHTVDESPRIMIGVHPYDLIAIKQMDKVYIEETPDDHYSAARKNTLIIASDILNVSEHSFAASMTTHIVEEGYDLLVTDLGDVVVIDVGSDAGKELLEKHGSFRDAAEDEIVRVAELRRDLLTKYEKKVNLEKSEWPKLLAKNYDHPVWEEKSKKCLACGSCTLVCPTCFCYDVEDLLHINGKEGVRRRTWDGCLLREFTMVASGEIFREKIEDRYRHRYFRKGHYLPDRYGFIACVGCGRCVSACLPDIADPSEIINTINESPLAEGKQVLTIPQISQVNVETTVSISLSCVPTSATIKRIEHLTYCETLYELVKDDHTPLGHQPGQFIQLSIFGIGEAPFSVSSAPGKTSFEIVVRQIGDVTSKLRTLKVGDKVGIRGPFGRGFDVKALKGKDLLFIAGGLGMVPMRSLINYVLKNRSQYNDVSILYGCKEPNEFLFWDEVSKWRERDDVSHMFTVDRCPEGVCWDGDIGVITTLLPKVSFNPETTRAIVIGPPIMYRYVIKELEKRGMKDENIFISLERRMRCGVGKCGHCQIHGIYVCKEGPVFSYDEIKELPEAI